MQTMEVWQVIDQSTLRILNALYARAFLQELAVLEVGRRVCGTTV